VWHQSDDSMHRSQDLTWSRSTAGSGALTMKAWIWLTAGMGIGYFRAKPFVCRLAQDVFIHHCILFQKLCLQSLIAKSRSCYCQAHTHVCLSHDLHTHA